MLLVTRRDAVLDSNPVILADTPILSSATYDSAKALKPGVDIYALEAEWRAWWATSGRTPLRNPNKAFLGWLEKHKR
jgi:hypothetical protein